MGRNLYFLAGQRTKRWMLAGDPRLSEMRSCNALPLHVSQRLWEYCVDWWKPARKDPKRWMCFCILKKSCSSCAFSEPDTILCLLPRGCSTARGNGREFGVLAGKQPTHTHCATLPEPHKPFCIICLSRKSGGGSTASYRQCHKYSFLIKKSPREHLSRYHSSCCFQTRQQQAAYSITKYLDS